MSLKLEELFLLQGLAPEPCNTIETVSLERYLSHFEILSSSRPFFLLLKQDVYFWLFSPFLAVDDGELVTTVVGLRQWV